MKDPNGRGRGLVWNVIPALAAQQKPTSRRVLNCGISKYELSETSTPGHFPLTPAVTFDVLMYVTRIIIKVIRL